MKSNKPQTSMLRTLLSSCLAIAISSAFGQLGANDTSFDPGSGANISVSAMALQTDGKILIGGFFTAYNGTDRNHVARVNGDGSLDFGFDPGVGADGEVVAIALQPDGKVLLGGYFSTYNGSARSHIARLQSDGTLDTGFNPGSGANQGTIYAIAIQADGKILIGGEFNTYNDIPQNYLARLNSDGSLDNTFNIGGGPNGWVYSIRIQPDGKILIGGNFSSFNGVGRNYIARLDSDGTLDTTFNTGADANSWIQVIALQSDGDILIGGNFTDYGGSGQNYLARLSNTGDIDAAFNNASHADHRIYAIYVRPDDNILVGGDFTTYNNVAINGIVQLDSDGLLNAAFDSITGTDGPVRAISTQSDGKILIAGWFTEYNGATRNGVTRILGDGNVGISDVSPLTSQHVSPNPAVNEITLPGSDEGYSWLIFDAQGRQLLGGYKSKGAGLIVDIGFLNAGTYLFVARNGMNNRSLRFNKL